MSSLSANSTMLDIVMDAFETVGRCASFQRVYPVVKSSLRRLNRDIPREIEAEVRQTAYLYCPASPNHLKQGDFFEKCGHGKYRIKRLKLEDFAID